jgi:hypothetical protein
LTNDHLFEYLYQPPTQQQTITLPTNPMNHPASPSSPLLVLTPLRPLLSRPYTPLTTQDSSHTGNDYAHQTPSPPDPPPTPPQQLRAVNDVLRDVRPKAPPKPIIEEPCWINDINDYSLRVASFNVDGMGTEQYHALFHHMDTQHIDILALIDTRMSHQYGTTTQALLTTRYRYRMIARYQQAEQLHLRIGGILFVYNDRICRPTLTDICKEGSTAMLNFQFGRKRMHVIATYWPIPNEDERSLWGKLKTHATRHDHLVHPAPYCSTTCRIHSKQWL